MSDDTPIFAAVRAALGVDFVIEAASAEDDLAGFDPHANDHLEEPLGGYSHG